MNPSPAGFPAASTMDCAGTRSPVTEEMGTAAHRFRQAMQTANHDLLVGTFAEDIQLFSPRSREPVQGVRAVGVFLWGAFSTFTQLRYVGHYVGRTSHEGGAEVETHVLRFEANGIRGDVLDGVDIIELNSDGLISTVTVMLRPFENISILKVLDRPARRPAAVAEQE